MKLFNWKKIINDKNVVYRSLLSPVACAVPDECETPLSFSRVSGRGVPGPSPSIAGIEVSMFWVEVYCSLQMYHDAEICFPDDEEVDCFQYQYISAGGIVATYILQWAEADLAGSVQGGGMQALEGWMGRQVLYISTRVSKEPSLSSRSSSGVMEIHLSVTRCPNCSSCISFCIAPYNYCSWFSCMKRRLILRLKNNMAENASTVRCLPVYYFCCLYLNSE